MLSLANCCDKRRIKHHREGKIINLRVEQFDVGTRHIYLANVPKPLLTGYHYITVTVFHVTHCSL